MVGLMRALQDFAVLQEAWDAVIWTSMPGAESRDLYRPDRACAAHGEHVPSHV